MTDEIESLRRELKASQEAAQSASQELQDVVYAIGHDLRAALRNVMSYSQLLQRQQPLPDESAEFTALILQGATEMNAFIDDVLAFSRAGGGGRRTTVRLNAIVQWAMTKWPPGTFGPGAAELEMQDLPEVHVNESEFVLVFHHLIGNALRFAGTDHPSILIGSDEGSESWVISVQDNGPGIAPEFQKQVFAPFKRLHGKDIPGRGLGLAICRKIIRAHGGEIWVESNGQHGSTFKFSIPF
jgi:signal transduction histidine kinase